MAITQTPDSSRATLVSKMGWASVVRKTMFGALLNQGVIYRPSEFKGNESGFRQLNYTFTGPLVQPALGRGQTAWGNEEALNIGDMYMNFGEYRKPVAVYGKYTIERLESSYDLDKEPRSRIIEYYGKVMDASVLNQAAGFNATSVTSGGIAYSSANGTINQVTGQNVILQPTNDRVIRSGNVANDQSLVAANKLTLTQFDYAAELMENSEQPFMGPLKSGADAIAIISPEQFVDLKLDTTSPVQWYNNVLAKAQGGDSSDLEDGGIFMNDMKPLFRYSGIDVYVSRFTPYGVNSSTLAPINTVRRAVILGKNALSYASLFGKAEVDDEDVPLKFFYQDGDYGYVTGIEGRLIMGLKKNQPTNGSDIGTIVISTYAAPHTQ